MGVTDGRRNNKGQVGKANKGGRPTNTTKQAMIERLSPMDNVALKALEDAIKEGQGWAVKLFLQYRLGMPKQSVSVETVTSPFTQIDINVIEDNSTAEDIKFTEES